MGYRIKERRDELRLTQEELAKKSGVSRATIVKLESGAECNVTTSTLLSLAKAMDTTVELLFF